MKKIDTKSGYIAYEATASETVLLGGCGICDDCGKGALNGYLVPVLNHYMCPDCFEDWQANAKYYPEDIPFEENRAYIYEAMIPMTEEPGQ